ncbi:hypothetical protein BOX15_Mlig006403g1 [Macrostomum lignano]|uniref:A2M domain-containing protein n=2 Tax=Macrostomum lignano TaxID=282301 RepID=A0A267EMF5_9PLAT|nr:hypothetical protein BOX15_Mlig006403g1 [Macrostomum lignano]
MKDKVFLILLFIKALWLCSCHFAEAQSGLPSNAFELGPQPTYFVLAPRKVRPSEVLQVSATCLRLLHGNLTIRLSVQQRISPLPNGFKEHAFVEETFQRPATRLMQMRMPPNMPPGDYSLFMEGSLMPKGGLLFYNRTELQYEAKEISIFIQTSKDVYHQNQIVRFRVIPVRPNLLPYSGTLKEITVVDASNTTVRRWLSPITNAGGIVERDFVLAPQIAEGTWNIRVQHQYYVYSKAFQVKEYWQPRFDVNVTVPPRLNEYDFGAYGLIMANHTSGVPVKGNCSIRLELRASRANPNSPPMAVLYRRIGVFEGKSDFLFTMSELRSATGQSQADLANSEVFVEVSVFDWLHLINVTSRAYSYIYSATPMFKFLGGTSRPFRPGMPMRVLMMVYYPDGTRLRARSNANMDLTIYCDNSAIRHTATGLPVPDTGLINYAFRPSLTDSCQYYRVNAVFREAYRSRTKDQYFYRHHSESNSYLQLSMSTANPRIDQYAVFHLETNYYSPEVYYQVAAGGNIVYADKISMPSNVLSKTFSLAISRDMAPIARLIAFFVRQDGEIVSDSLTFFSNLTQTTDVSVEFNRGKDLNVDTIEINGYAQPGSYMSFSAVHYDLFVHGSTQVLRDFHLIDELKSYESHAQQPFEHIWMHSEDNEQRVYVPSPSFGPDTNKTMNYSGLILFTDSNYTKVSFAHDCNETIDPKRAYPCYMRSGGSNQAQGSICYSRAQQCDGNIDCPNAMDEMGCPEPFDPEAPAPRDKSKMFSYLSRHYDDGGWLWKSIFVKPNGRIDFRVELPKIDTFWVVGAFSLDKAYGLAIQQRPALMSGFRRFFITVEAPEVAYWGEQIGVRVAVFNYWDYWTETLVEVQRSNQFEVVSVGWRGAVDSYAPITWRNETVQTLVYLEAGQSRYIYFPVMPVLPGNTSFTICASSYIGGNCVTRTVQVLMNGVTNFYHTPHLFDLTAASKLRANNFWIEVPQDYVEPEQRELRFVPGSQQATMTVVGDIVGPGLNEVHEFGTCESSLNLPAGAAENVLFELGYNVQLLRYQLDTKQLRDEVRNKGLDYCNVAIQRAMSYFNSTEGAFQNFRENDRPSVWLSAYGLFVLMEAAFNEWDKFIYIEYQLANKLIAFLESRQDNGTANPLLAGSFAETSAKWDRKFFPEPPAAVTDETVREALRRVPVTSLVVIAMRHSNIPKESGTAAATVADLACAFLRQQLDKIDDVFSLSMAAYALSFTNDHYRQQAFNLLHKRARFQTHQYWSDAPIPDLLIEATKGSTFMIHPRKEFPNDAYGTMTSALAMTVTRLVGGESSRANWTSVAKWLNSMRNWNRGFSSTLDTLFSLKILRDVASRDLNREIYVMDVEMDPSSLTDFNHTVKIRQHNFSTPTYISIPPVGVWGEIIMNAEGSGTSLLQLDVSVNVEHRHQLRTPKDPTCFATNPDCSAFPNLRTFDLNCRAEYSGRNSSIMMIGACAKWQLVSKAPTSGMAVLDIKVPTGYIVMNDYLRELRNSNSVPGLRRAIYNYRTGEVSFFFDTIGPSTDTCLQFRADRWFPIANQTIHHKCKVYEYYEPSVYNSSKYETMALFSNHICSVCGSFQCPYCPDYNAAVAMVTNPILLLLVALTTVAMLVGDIVKSKFNCVL